MLLCTFHFSQPKQHYTASIAIFSFSSSLKYKDRVPIMLYFTDKSAIFNGILIDFGSTTEHTADYVGQNSRDMTSILLFQQLLTESTSLDRLLIRVPRVYTVNSVTPNHYRGLTYPHYEPRLQVYTLTSPRENKHRDRR